MEAKTEFKEKDEFGCVMKIQEAEAIVLMASYYVSTVPNGEMIEQIKETRKRFIDFLDFWYEKERQKERRENDARTSCGDAKGEE